MIVSLKEESFGHLYLSKEYYHSKPIGILSTSILCIYLLSGFLHIIF